MLAAFLAGRSPHTVDAYQRDLDDFCGFVRRHTLTLDRNPLGQRAQDIAALRWFLDQAPGRANEISLNYRNDLMTRHKATATVARHISVVKSIVKYARMIGLVTWSIEIPVRASSAAATYAGRAWRRSRPC